MKIKKSLKNQNFDTISHTRTQKRGVPEEAKIGRTITRFGFWINLMKIKISHKNQNFDTISHARCRLEPKMDALQKLITEENNGSRDAPTTGSSRDADSR